MSDVALAVFSATGVATADFLVALAVNAAKREYRKRMTGERDGREREEQARGESRKSNLQRTSCALLRGCTDVHIA